MTNKKNYFFVAVVALVVGYVVGDLVRFPSVDENKVSGDISKVDLYSNQMEDPELALAVEQLQNDTAFMNQTKLCIAALKERTSILSDLTNRTVEMCDEVPDLQEAMKGIRSLQAKSYNSTLALDQTIKSLEKIEKGEKAPEFEQVSNNSYATFMRIENSLDVAKQFVDASVAFLKDKQGEEFDEMANLVAEWSSYCVEDAVLNNSEEKLTAWLDKIGSMQSSSLSDNAMIRELHKWRKELGSESMGGSETADPMKMTVSPLVLKNNMFFSSQPIISQYINSYGAQLRKLNLPIIVISIIPSLLYDKQTGKYTPSIKN
ncbi:MAG: hypothetical protein MJZ08_01150 [Bacteroidaceae bacterium]|nr:hypothetical protein [Bacteroidaceae bacterium]